MEGEPISLESSGAVKIDQVKSYASTSQFAFLVFVSTPDQRSQSRVHLDFWSLSKKRSFARHFTGSNFKGLDKRFAVVYSGPLSSMLDFDIWPHIPASLSIILLTLSKGNARHSVSPI